MTAVVIKDKPVERGVQISSDGGYARCPEDGTLIPRQFKNGGRTLKKGEDYLHWSMYNHDRKDHGCGTTFAVDTKQGVAEAEKQGRPTPRYVDSSAATGRSYSMPSEQFSDNYSRIFGHD